MNDPIVGESPAQHWFGARFEALHPLLQHLHRHGGILTGEITFDTGRGPAAWFGKRLARSLSIPAGIDRCGFEVDIRHTDQGLLWERRFQDGSRVVSMFEPVGTWPDGYWIERTGPVALRLTVDVIDEGWYWRVLGARYRGVPIPRRALPVSRAWKRIENGQYRFHVEFALPLLGTVLAYGGLLRAAGSPGDVD